MTASMHGWFERQVARRAALVFRDLVINGVAAWPIIPGPLRQWIYCAFGMRIETHGVSPGCFFGGADVAIGARTTVNYRCFFDTLAPVKIGRDCAIGMEVLICTSGHELGPPPKRAGRPVGSPTTIGDGCWIGGRVVVLPGVEIGDGCVVAAGSVVTRSCLPNGLYAGVPARRIRDLNEDVSEPRQDQRRPHGGAAADTAAAA